MEICTYNTDFKKRLTDFAIKYPAECSQLDDDGNGCRTFAVKKGRFGIRLTAPYSEKRRQAANEASEEEHTEFEEDGKMKFLSCKSNIPGNRVFAVTYSSTNKGVRKVQYM